jgi:SAM-dependent methyltransferase
MKPDTAREMQDHWQRFGCDDPAFYTLNLPATTAPEEFLAHGAAMVADAMAWFGDGMPRGRLLEVGCGMGRTAINFCRIFERVDAVDIAPAMLERVRSLGAPPNLHLALVNGKDLANFADGQFDAAYSYVVFQHIPDASVVESYIREIARVLRVGGRAIIQFDTRPSTVLHRLYKSLPDAVLPRPHRRFIRRYRRDPVWLRRVMQGAGLRILEERGCSTSEHFFLLERAGPARTIPA